MSKTLSFDTLMDMAKNNPEQLEAYRQQEIEKIINAAPESYRRRLRGLQFQIDANRQLHAHSPMGSCIKISEMMHQSFNELRFYLNQLSNTNDPLANTKDPLAPHLKEKDYDDLAQVSGAEILPFETT